MGLWILDYDVVAVVVAVHGDCTVPSTLPVPTEDDCSWTKSDCRLAITHKIANYPDCLPESQEVETAGLDASTGD